ncbi:hypothetical protein ABK040_010463 [Willaertia magna]
MPPTPKKKPALEEIMLRFHLPLQKAAEDLGICQTLLKKFCRQYGINRWPYRKIKSILLKDNSTADQTDDQEYKEKVLELMKNNKDLVFSSSNSDSDSFNAQVMILDHTPQQPPQIHSTSIAGDVFSSVEYNNVMNTTPNFNNPMKMYPYTNTSVPTTTATRTRPTLQKAKSTSAVLSKTDSPFGFFQLDRPQDPQQHSFVPYNPNNHNNVLIMNNTNSQTHSPPPLFNNNNSNMMKSPKMISVPATQYTFAPMNTPQTFSNNNYNNNSGYSPLSNNGVGFNSSPRHLQSGTLSSSSSNSSLSDLSELNEQQSIFKRMSPTTSQFRPPLKKSTSLTAVLSPKPSGIQKKKEFTFTNLQVSSPQIVVPNVQQNTSITQKPKFMKSVSHNQILAGVNMNGSTGIANTNENRLPSLNQLFGDRFVEETKPINVMTGYNNNNSFQYVNQNCGLMDHEQINH